MNKALIVILATVLLDAVGIGLIFPILPQLLRDVTDLPEITPLIGIMISLYALMQFFFSPVLGALSDRFGRRPVLLISLAGAALDYVVMAFTPELWMLLVGRAVAGITSANMAVATAYITDITAEDKRAERCGYIHAMFGIGFLIGPILGGVLGEYWVRAPFLAAAFLNLTNFGFAYFVLPESRVGEKTPITFKALNPFRLLKWSLGIKALAPFLIIFFILGFMGEIYGTVWVLYGEDAFNWSPFVIGMSLGAFGLFHALVQGFLPGPAARYFGERNAFLVGMAAELFAMVIIAFTTDGWVVFLLLPVFSLGGIGGPALHSMVTRSVTKDQQGRLQGVLTSLTSVASIFGPLFFAGAYFATKTDWPGAIWLIGAACYLLVVPFILGLKVEKPAE